MARPGISARAYGERAGYALVLDQVIGSEDAGEIDRHGDRSRAAEIALSPRESDIGIIVRPSGLAGQLSPERVANTTAGSAISSVVIDDSSIWPVAPAAASHEHRAGPAREHRERASWVKLPCCYVKEPRHRFAPCQATLTQCQVKLDLARAMIAKMKRPARRHARDGRARGVVARTRCAMPHSNPPRSPFQVNYGNRPVTRGVTRGYSVTWPRDGATGRAAAAEREEQAFAAEVGASAGERRARRGRAPARAVRLSRRARSRLAPPPPRPRSPTPCSASPTPKATTPPPASTSIACASGSRISTPPRATARAARGWSCRPALTRCASPSSPRRGGRRPRPPRRQARRWPYALALAAALALAVLAGRMLPGPATRRRPTPSGSRSSNPTARSWWWSATTTCSARSIRSGPSRAG